MSDLPEIEDTVMPGLPDIEDKIRERWAHRKLISATMTINETETKQGRPQLEVVLNTDAGAAQLFWIRREEKSSNWMLSRALLPFINTVRKAKSQALYPFGQEMAAETLEAYIAHPYIQGLFTSGIQVRVITSTRPSVDANGKAVNRSSFDFCHLTDEGSQDIFDNYAKIRDSAATKTASELNANFKKANTASALGLG